MLCPVQCVPMEQSIGGYTKMFTDVVNFTIPFMSRMYREKHFKSGIS